MYAVHPKSFYAFVFSSEKRMTRRLQFVNGIWRTQCQLLLFQLVAQLPLNDPGPLTQQPIVAQPGTIMAQLSLNDPGPLTHQPIVAQPMTIVAQLPLDDPGPLTQQLSGTQPQHLGPNLRTKQLSLGPAENVTNKYALVTG